MKSLLPLLFLIPVLGFGQNYQPFHSNSFQLFYQEKEFNYWGNYEDQFGFNMWGTRIDSFLIQGNGDTLYFNYPIYRDTTGNNNCIWWNAPNWNGSSTRIDTIGNAWFQNKNGESVLIRYSDSISESWLAYTYSNGDSLIGTVASVDWVDDDWIADSIKTISFARMSSGLIVEDSINQVFFEVYQNHGFRTMVDFTKFPNSFDLIFQVDPNTLNLNSPPFIEGQNIYLGSKRPKPHLGDGDYYRFSSFTLPDNTGSSNSRSRLFTAIDSSASDGSIVVTATVNNSPSSSSTHQLVFIPNPDTVYRTLISESFGEIEGDYLPRMGGAAYKYNPGLGSCAATVYTTSCNQVYTDGELPTDSCLSGLQYLVCFGGWEKIFMPYVGYIDYNEWYHDFNFTDHLSARYNYLKVGDMVCGNYAMVGIDESPGSSALNLYPNPAINHFTIESSLNSIQQVSVYNAQGKLVFRGIINAPSSNVDCSNWPLGIYLVRIESEKGISTQKLLVQ